MLVLPLGIAWFTALTLALLDGRRCWVGWLAVAGLAASFAATLRLAVAVLGYGPLELVTGGWPAGVGIRLRADALGVAFAVLASGVLLISLIYESLSGVTQAILPALILFMNAGLTGLFLTSDAFNFYVFFEVSMMAGFVLASYGRDPRQARDALIFTVVNLLGSALFLIGVVALYHLTGTLDMRQIAERIVAVDPSSVILIAALIFAAFSVKLGLFPFHYWLPAVYSGAHPAVAAILSGALANIGSYGLLRFGAGMLPKELALGATALLIVGAASVVYGSLVAIYRRSPTETLAYSSISQAGYILIALSVGGRAGYAAAVIYALLNGLNKALLFLAAELRGGLAPAAFAIGAFSVAGLPPAAGFFGKAALFQAGIASGSVTLVTLIFVGGALSFVYMFQTYQREFWTAQAARAVSPLGLRVVAFTLACLLIALGLWPEPLLALGEQAAFALRGE